MAFLDNSGDIILDAVLTDAGRYKLAKGDGSFRIEKFALGDDEIDYGLYNNQDPRGSAYYDIEILSTPVLEAFTDNMSGMKSKLLSISRNNLLYLPIVKLSEKDTSNELHPLGAFLVAVDRDTENAFTWDSKAGVLFGVSKEGERSVLVEQGLDTTEIPITTPIQEDLRETQYIVEIDNRLGSLRNTAGDPAAVSYIDDDNMASYYFTVNTDSTYTDVLSSEDATEADRAIRGPQGSYLQFKIKSSLELETSSYLFQKLGKTFTLGLKDINTDVITTTFHYIDTTVRVIGATTGNKIDIPVRFIKLA